jgi:hypothetical protein
MSLFSKDAIDFQVKDPKGYIIFAKTNKKEGIFNFTTSMMGDFEFVFSNLQVFM